MANPFGIAASQVISSATSRSYAITAATAAGDTICVAVTANSTTIAVSGVSDSKGNVYTLDGSSISSSPSIYLFRSPGATGGSGGGPTAALATSDTLTVTSAAISATVQLAATCAPAVGAVDQIATVTTGTGTASSVSVTPTAANEILVGAANVASGATTFTVSAPFTGSVQVHVAAQWLDMGYNVLTGGSGVAQTFSCAVGGSQAWKAGLWSFLPSPPALLPQQVRRRAPALFTRISAPGHGAVYTR